MQMKLLKVVRVPEAKLNFTPDDIKQLMHASDSHYDGLCRSMSQRGGLIYGLKNRSEWSDEKPTDVDLCINWHNLDLLCKVAESPACSRDIYMTLTGALGELD